MAGLYTYRDTFGMPLECILEVVKTHLGGVPDWPALYREMAEQGMAHGRILSALREAVADVWDPEFRDVVVGRLEQLYGGVK